MIREASVYTLLQLSNGELAAYGLRVLVMRRWPRGVSRKHIDLWLPDAAPSQNLLTRYRLGGLSWEVFVAAYREEQERAHYCQVVSYPMPLLKRISAIYKVRPVDQLKRFEQCYGTMTLLCWEQAQDGRCHRYILKDLAEK